MWCSIRSVSWLLDFMGMHDFCLEDIESWNISQNPRDGHGLFYNSWDACIIVFMCFRMFILPGRGRAAYCLNQRVLVCKGILYSMPRLVMSIRALAIRVFREYYESRRQSLCNLVRMTWDMIQDIEGISSFGHSFMLQKLHGLMWSLVVFNQLRPREWWRTKVVGFSQLW